MGGMTITVTQGFQLAALGPCLFLMLYLCISAQEKRLVFIPVLFFLSLTLSFVPPLLSIFPPANVPNVRTALVFNEHLIPVISFLFILQLILRKPPPFVYWLIFALPLIGGWPLLHLSLTEDEICITDDGCIPAHQVMTLYRVVGSAIIFMLLVVFLWRMPRLRRNDTSRRQKYWLITMMILYSLLVMAIDLAQVAGSVTPKGFVFIKTMLGISFLYLVTTSVFRVFRQTLRLGRNAAAKDKDEKLSESVVRLLEKEKPYLKLGYNRGAMADHFRVTEQHLSRVINRHFHKSFSELMNEYRMEDAKILLKTTKKPVTTIAFDCGFASITSFNRVFKEFTGISPSAYRRQGKE